jgi:hypothetical protein
MCGPAGTQFGQAQLGSGSLLGAERKRWWGLLSVEQQGTNTIAVMLPGEILAAEQSWWDGRGSSALAMILNLDTGASLSRVLGERFAVIVAQHQPKDYP